MQENQSYHFSLFANTISLSFSLSISMVQPSHRVHVPWQRLTDSGPKEEKRGEWIIALGLNFIVLSFWLAPTAILLFLLCRS